MIPYPSKNFFRQQLVFGFIVWVVNYLVGYFAYDVNSMGEADALEWNYYGSTIPYELCWALTNILSVMFVIGVIGMIFFKGWARILLLVELVIASFTTPFMGLIVTTGASDMLASISYVLIGVPWVLSFFEPCSSYFNPLEDREILRRKIGDDSGENQ